MEIGESITMEVKASEPYSTYYLVIQKNELYQFDVSINDKWKDWFITTNADGFNNWLLLNKCKRVPNEKCFKLCGTVGKNEANHFAIGTNKKWQSPRSGKLYFFANDSKKLNKNGDFKYYKNNRGEINLKIRRIS